MTTTTIRSYVAILALIIVASTVGPDGAAQVASRPAAEFAAFIDELLAPGKARPNDLSAERFADDLNDTKARLTRLQAIDPERLSFDDRIDWRFVESIFRHRELNLDKIQLWKKDPRVYLVATRITDVGGTHHKYVGLPVVLGAPGDPAAKADEVLFLLRLIPQQLKNGKQNLAVYVPRFQELALRQIDGALHYFEREIPALADTVTVRKAEILSANYVARTTLISFRDFLKNDLPERPPADWAVGRSVYDELLARQLLPYDSESLSRFGWDSFNEQIAELERVARKIDPSKDWLAMSEEIRQDGPDPRDITAAYQQWIDKAKAHMVAKQVVPTLKWKERVITLSSSSYQSGTWGFWRFQFFRPEGPDTDGVHVGKYLVDPFESSWSVDEQKEYRREFDWAMVTIMAQHETYPGHFVQGLYQNDNPRRLRRAFRVSVFGEGWALYSEQVMKEVGYVPNARVELRQLQGLLSRTARLLCDVEIHNGRMSYQEAVALLRDRVGFSQRLAELEVNAVVATPGSRVSWLIGRSEILKLRSDYKEQMGAQFTLSDFHDRLLKLGSLPPPLMREALFHTLSEQSTR